MQQYMMISHQPQLTDVLEALRWCMKLEPSHKRRGLGGFTMAGLAG